ncbi:MAG: S-layer homology domain-containing protein [Ezakiella sp.]|nr:S-layer homology domain-containing protein [Ezakiella sp.]MDD7472041.1 S-layer homology domain-containing protein [Bacillota bacterium]MDY3924005.1 S-layer homology domain-containing protein [Ezakiella sp.]
MKKLISVLLVLFMLVAYVPVINAEGEKITGISIDGQNLGLQATKTVSNKGGEIRVIVSTENLEDLKCMLQFNGDKKPVEYYDSDVLGYESKKLKDGFLLTINLPENKSETDKEYLFRFKATSYNDASLKLIVSSEEEVDNPGDDVDNPDNPDNPKPGEDIKDSKILGFSIDNGSLVKTFSENIKNEIKTYKLNVLTQNVNNIQIRCKANGIYTTSGITSAIKKIDDNKFEVTLVVQENYAKSCKKYEIEIGRGDIPADYSDGIKLNINIDGTENKCTIQDDEDPAYERTTIISRVSDTENISEDVLNMTLDSKKQEKKLFLTLINGDLLKDGDLDALVKKNGQIDNSIKVVFTGENNSRIATFSFPENTTESDITYEITFMIKYKMQNNKKVTILQNKKSEEIDNCSIDLFILTNENIPLSGGSIGASVFGENIDLKGLSLKVFDAEEDITDSLEITNFVGRDDVATSTIKLKESSVDKNYTVKLYFNGKEKYSQDVVQNKYGSNNDSFIFEPIRSFKYDNKIIVEFAHDIFEAYPNALKENTEIAFDGTAVVDRRESKYVQAEPKFEKIKENDMVEIQGNKIVVTLAEEREFKNTPQIRFGFRTMFNDQGFYNGRKDNQIRRYYINDGKAIILSAEFLTDSVLLSNGGDVELKVNGLDLTDDEQVKTYTRAKIIKIENLKKDSEQTEIAYKVEGKGSEQTLKFTLPKNISNRTESYSIMLSTDGRLYLSDINANYMDRLNFLVVSVLPEGKNKDDMTLGFARIHSYGTNGGSDEAPDITHTIPPIGQESKKTWITIYGTNLKNPMTKVRAKAEVPAGSGKYVYWYPVNDGTQDSGDKFIMVGVSKGLYGRGNVQRLEVIAPRGYRGDMTYTYEIAIDGVHYDSEVTTTVLLKDDGEDPGVRKKHEFFVRNLPIKYQDEQGNEIKDSESLYVMKNMPLRVVGIDKAPTIEGYKYKELKGLNSDLTPELAKIELLKKLQEDGKITDEEKEELTKLLQWVKGHENIEFDTIIGDMEELIFVYEKTEKEEQNPEVETNPNRPPVESYPNRPQVVKYDNGYISKKENKISENKNEISKPILRSAKFDIKDPILPIELIDIPEDKYGEAIKNMVRRGILVGTSKLEFSPEVPISRAMLTEVLRRMAVNKSFDNNIKFSDINDDAWYSDSVKWAAFNHIVNGYPDGYFRPNKKITREEFAVIICRLLDSLNIQLPEQNEINISKYENLPKWSKDAIIRMGKLGLIEIEPTGEFNPNSFISRKELAFAIDRIIEFTLNN